MEFKDVQHDEVQKCYEKAMHLRSKMALPLR